MLVVQRVGRRAFPFAKAAAQSVQTWRCFGTGKGEVPDEFYDESVEDDKEFFDIVTSMEHKNNLRSMSILNKPVQSWHQYSRGASRPVDGSKGSDQWADDAATDAIRSAIGAQELGDSPGDVEEKHFDKVFDDGSDPNNEVMKYFSEAGESNPYLPPEMMNYSVPSYENADEETHNFLEHFIPSTAPEKFSMHEQGFRHCEGKKQRHGKSKELRCHLIDLDAVHVMDVASLKRFVTDDGEIMGRKITGLCAKCQRKVARTIKHSRNMGMMPHLGQFVLRDGKPQAAPAAYHSPMKVSGEADPATGEKKRFVKQMLSKTIVH